MDNFTGKFGQSIDRTTIAIASLCASFAISGCNCDTEEPITSLQPKVELFNPSTGDRNIEVLDFGQVPLGASKTLALGVKNAGQAKLEICVDGATNCTELTGLEPADAPFSFTFDNTDPEDGTWDLPSNQEREIAIRFTPQTESEITAGLIFIHNAPDRTTTLRLNGQGVMPMVDVTPQSLDFGDTTVDQRNVLQVTLTNGTQFVQPVTIEAIMQDSLVFGVVDPRGGDIPPGENLTFEIAGNETMTLDVFFQPPSDGDHRNLLQLSYCDTCQVMIDLRGNGVKPLFELDPASIDFGPVEDGQTVADAFVVRNIGNVPLTVFAVDLEPGTTNEFMPTPQVALPAVLQPTEELIVDVTYTSMSPGEDLGRIEVSTNAWDDPATMLSETIGFVSVRATGSGPEIDAFPPNVNFGTVAIGGSAPRPLSILNAGNAPLDISNMVFNTPTGEITAMNVPTGFPLTVQPGTSIDMTFMYNPIDAGMDMADLTITSSDRDEPTMVVPIRGIGGVPTTCSVNVAPAQLTFGLVERGRTAVLPVEIRNGGAQPCTLSNIRLTGDGEFGLIAGNPGTVTVPPGGNQQVDISFSPAAYGQFMTLLEFDSDDPGQPNVQVPISGVSEQSDVLVIPSSIDFAVVPVRCRSPIRTISVYNTGNSVVTVNNIALDPTTTPEFELSPIMTPQQLSPGGQLDIQVRYHPQDIGRDNGVLFISHSNASVPVAVPLAGDGQVNPTVTDVFSQLASPQADVLFVVDNSCSMSEEQRNLGDNLAAFLQFASAQGIDYQISVTTTDVSSRGERGGFVGPPLIITPSTPNADAAFRSNVTQGTGGSGTERGLEAAYLALSDPMINTTNAGFLRTDAALAVVIVSDETDQSTRATTFYEDFLRNIKGFQNSTQFSLSAVVGTMPGGCRSAAGDADYAPRYINVANNTGGVVESICSANWGQTLSNIGLNSFGLKRQFQLSSTPVAITIAVDVDGTAIPSQSATGTINWSFDQMSNSIIFSTAAVPAAGATIQVTYSVACLN